MRLKDEFITYETDGEQIMVAAGTDSFSGLVRSNETAGFIVECLKKTAELQNPQDTAHARIYDRVLEMCLPILFTGENFRKETAQAKLNGLKELLK